MMAQRMVVQNPLSGLVGGKEEKGKGMIDCMESGLSRRIRPLLLEEHHLLSVWVTHSAALTCSKGAC